MKTISIGSKKNHLQMTQIVLGSVFFGTTIQQEVAEQIIHAYLSAGGNCIDTGRVYASWLENGNGASEKAIGKYLEKTKIREKIIISTKGGHPCSESMEKNRLDHASLTTDLGESLSFLKTSYVDLYFLHRDDINLPVSEIMPTLHEFVISGKVRILGASNWTSSRIEEANEYAEKYALTPFSVSQIQWSYAKVNPDGNNDKTLITMNKSEYNRYTQNNFPVMAYSSQAGGFYSKFLRGGEQTLSEQMKKLYLNEENKLRAQAVKKTAEKNGASPTSAALGFFLSKQQFPVAAVIGPNTVEQLSDTLKADTIAKQL